MVSHLSKTEMCVTVLSKNPSDLHNLRRHTRSSVHCICITECLARAKSCSELVEYTGEQSNDPWCQGPRGTVGRTRHTLKKHFVGSEQSNGGVLSMCEGQTAGRQTTVLPQLYIQMQALTTVNRRLL